MKEPEIKTRVDRIQPAFRTSLVQEYYFSGKLREIAEMKHKGIDVINLGIGSPDLPPSAGVIKTLSHNAAQSCNHGYQNYRGIYPLRSAFAKWYKKYFSVDLNPENEILPLIGSKEGIMHISMAFINPGDEVLVPDPGYPAYTAAARLAGGNVRTYDLTEERGWLPDIAAIEKKGVEKIKLMWINYPHMPTGARASAKLFYDLVDFARCHGIMICNDNPYSFILNTDFLSLLSIPGAKDVALELNSLSKSHNMAGWRVGMLAGSSFFLEAVLRVKSNMDSGMFQPVQAAAAEALSAPDTWYHQLNEIYARRRSVAVRIMDSLSCRYDQHQTGLFLWGRIPDRYNDAVEMTENLLHERHLFVTPGSVFGSNGKKYIRISLCADEQLLNAALKRISANV